MGKAASVQEDVRGWENEVLEKEKDERSRCPWKEAQFKTSLTFLAVICHHDALPSLTAQPGPNEANGSKLSQVLEGTKRGRKDKGEVQM